jgi:hypothetical protein
MRIFFLYFLSVFFVDVVTVLQANSDDVSVIVEVYPKEISFGDIFFSSITIENNSDTRFVSEFKYHSQVIPPAGILTNAESEQVLYNWFFITRFEPVERGIQRMWIMFPKEKIIERKTHQKIDLTMFCLPLFAPPGNDIASELREMISKGESKFTFEWAASLKLYRESKKNVDDLRYGYFSIFDGNNKSDVKLLKTSLVVRPRTNEILDILRTWYRELPYRCNPKLVPLFVDYSYARNSPHLQIPVEYDIAGRVVKPTLKDRESLSSLRQEFYVAFKEFVKSLRTRTPELLSRIKRTKELETELLKLPDSELSQNMKEFIKLRGYLVDIRFAENETAENNAFDDLVKFVDKSKDKELWIQFVEEVAFDSIFDAEYFPYKKVQNYRKRFAEKFTPQNK